jgi:hypothetical protein
MCGIVGMAGNINKEEKKMFRDLLIFDQVRGFDSVGIVGVRLAPKPNESEVFVDKEIGAAQNLWEYSGTNDYSHRGILNGGFKMLLGHNRAATLGAVNLQNAHPFTFGKVTGVHNGSLTYWKDLHDAHTFDVDSKAIYSDIAHKGIENTWKSFLGAAALVWWDEATDRLNMVRNDERPLVLAESEKGDTLFWASEGWMITVAAYRSGVKLKLDKDKNPRLVSLTPHKLKTFQVNAMSYKLMEEKELEKKSFPKTWTTNIGGTGTSNSNVTNFSQRVDLTKMSRFLNKNWKTGTSRTDEEFSGVHLDNLRKIKRQGFGLKGLDYEWVFRLAMVDDAGVLRGTLDLCPQNKKEFKLLIGVEDSILDSGAKYEITLRNKPRVRDHSPSAIPSYVATPSSVSFKKVEVKETKIEEPLYQNSNKDWVTKSDLEKDLRSVGDCCSWCNSSIEVGDEINWVDKDSVLCKECDLNWGGQLHQMLG